MIKRLSIIIPVFNEEKTVRQVIKKVGSLVFDEVEKEVIVVDDGSTDATASTINNLQLTNKSIKIFRHTKNQGKGAAVRTGIAKATGDYIIIQDADLEYNPDDIKKLLSAVKKDKVVYGTRLNRLPNFQRDERTPQFFIHYMGNRFLSLLTSVLYGKWLTDIETGYKLFPKEVLKKIELRGSGFEFEAEVTVKLLKKGYAILEVPIVTNPRGYDKGKKLDTVSDGIKALWTLLKYRFTD